MSSINCVLGLRQEVMKTIGKSVDFLSDKYLRRAEETWQPGDLLPNSRDDNFFQEVEELQELARGMSHDLLAVLIGDTITEEALPSYEAWLMSIEGIDPTVESNWLKWVRGWTAEENRHGDLLNRYLYLSGRVDMREFEMTTQNLISDGFDPGTGTDPYKSFVFTSFQELATNVSHRRVGAEVKKIGDERLSRICGLIAADEARHASAYKKFVSLILGMDPSGLIVAFAEMMKKKIVMPACKMRETGEIIGGLFKEFSFAAQRTQVYTTEDYIEILKSLLSEWDIDHVEDLNDQAEKARDYLMTLPARLERISGRMTIPREAYPFTWILP